MGKTLRLTRQGFEVIPDMAGKVTGKEAAWGKFHVLPGVVFYRNEAPHFVTGLGEVDIAVGQYVRLTVYAYEGVFQSAALGVAASIGNYYEESEGAETYRIAIAHRTRAGITQYHQGAVWLSQKYDDIYAAVNSDDSADYLEEQFTELVKEGKAGALTANGLVKFSVLDSDGDKKITADVRLDAYDAYGLTKDSTTPSAPTLRVRVKNSVELDSGSIQLVNDEDNPAAADPAYYGTNAAGVKGYHAFRVELTRITVVTAVQYDTGTKKLQYKTRTAYVYSPSAESDWADMLQFCDTQVDLTPELRINEASGEYTLDVRMRKVRLTLTDGVLCLAAGDYGDWSSLCACPEGGSGS